MFNKQGILSASKRSCTLQLMSEDSLQFATVFTAGGNGHLSQINLDNFLLLSVVRKFRNIENTGQAQKDIMHENGSECLKFPIRFCSI